MNTRKNGPAGALLELLASFGLCCVLLLCMFVLTVAGTLHQVENPLDSAIAKFFTSWVAWLEWGKVSLPFPGGILCMGLLAINLILGGFTRVRFAWRNSGVLIVHFGILFMLVAGLIEMLTSKDGRLLLHEGDRSDFFQSWNRWEVAIWDIAEPTEQIVEQELFTDLDGDSERRFTTPDLPFELIFSSFVPNAKPLPKGPMWTAAGPVVDGYGLRALELTKQSEQHLAGLHARIAVAGAEAQQGILWGGTLLPWTFESEGRTWAVKLRRARYPMPFAIQLDDFQMEEYPGTRKAKAYRSYVTKVDENSTEKVLIEMNEPLRREGLVLYQSSWGPDRGDGRGPYSVLRVVRNPSDRWPEYAMWVITLGMLIAFGRRLQRFLVTQNRQTSNRTGGAL